jgi:hypothetical protein
MGASRAAEIERTVDDAIASGKTAQPADPRPEIRIVPGDLPNMVDQAEAALLAAIDTDFYQRAGMVVRPVLTKLTASDDRVTEGWRLVSVERAHCVDVMTRTIQFRRYARRTKTWVLVDAPGQVAATWLAREGEWRLPVIAGVMTTPFLRRDGTLCDQPGYDAASGLLYRPDCEFPPLPEHPSRDDADAALDAIEGLIATFPFTSKASESVALSAILTAVDRKSMPTAPLHAMTAPLPGTGKSLLADVAALIATGRPIPVISQGRDEDEFEKRLGAALLAGDQLISIDNCIKPIGGSLLCQALSQPVLNIRILGLSRNAVTPNDALIFATGNNLEIEDDATRRVLLCTLDAQCERPELRRFDVSIVDHVKAHRAALVTAILTVLRAWHLSGERCAVEPLGSFEAWSRRVREALVWLDRTDPVETMTVVRASDPKREALTAVLLQWEKHLGAENKFTTRQLIDAGENRAEWKHALLVVAGRRGAQDVVSPDRLGRYLKANQGKITRGLAIRSAGRVDGFPYWRLERSGLLRL